MPSRRSDLPTPLENGDHISLDIVEGGGADESRNYRSFDSGEVTDVGTEGSVGADVVAFVLDDVVVVVQPQSAQIVNLWLAKVAGAAGEVGCS